jgi:hypothetical protein
VGRFTYFVSASLARLRPVEGLQPFQAVQQSANAGWSPFAAVCRRLPRSFNSRAVGIHLRFNSSISARRDTKPADRSSWMVEAKAAACSSARRLMTYESDNPGPPAAFLPCSTIVRMTNVLTRK